MLLGAVIMCCTCKSNLIVAGVMFQTWDVFHVTKLNFPWEILTFMRLWLIKNTVYVFAVDTKLSVRIEVLMLVTMKIIIFWDVMLHCRVDARATRFHYRHCMM
jgi:hypothetical protein